MKYKNHLSVGHDTPIHKGSKIAASITNGLYNDFVLNLEENYDFDIAFVIAAVEHRPDLISDLFYDTPELDWLIMLANNIQDPFEDLNTGDRIRIPKI